MHLRNDGLHGRRPGAGNVRCPHIRLSKVPILLLLCGSGRAVRGRLGEPEKAFGVFTQTLGELVAPFPRRGGPGPVLLRQVGRYEHTVLVIGVRLHVRDMDDVGDLGDPPFVSRKFGGVAALICFRFSSIISGVTRCMAASVLRPVQTSSTMEA